MWMAAGLSAAALLAGCASKAPQPKTSGGWLKDQVADAYTFGFPLVASDIARERAAGGDANRPGQAPLNTLRHATALPPVGAPGTPSVDTLESTAWLDVASEPVIVSLPAAPRGRYYDARAFDAWTNVLYSSAERAPFPKAQTIAFVPAGWKGNLPAGAMRIESTTRYVWLSIRVRVNGQRDVREARKLQTAMQVETLSGAQRAVAAADSTPAATGAWPGTTATVNANAAATAERSRRPPAPCRRPSRRSRSMPTRSSRASRGRSTTIRRPPTTPTR